MSNKGVKRRTMVLGSVSWALASGLEYGGGWIRRWWAQVRSRAGHLAGWLGREEYAGQAANQDAASEANDAEASQCCARSAPGGWTWRSADDDCSMLRPVARRAAARKIAAGGEVWEKSQTTGKAG